MLWAVLCLCFFGFLRSGEVVAPDNYNFNPAQHLTFADVTVDCLANPSLLLVNIKQSKKDLFRSGVKVIVERTEEELCPVAAMVTYMDLHDQGDGPLFRFKDGHPLMQQGLVTKMWEMLKRIGIDCQKYSGHSFRIGAATTAACQGVQDLLLKKMGRWESVTYQLYVQTPREQLAAVASTLAGPS